ncbi:MAG: SdiA-regulated domain-containing protein [Ignavibacteriales bacterium]|nr:SdiA-regulated domain-containing protein [Ignavibacteriales bacterium]
MKYTIFLPSIIFLFITFAGCKSPNEEEEKKPEIKLSASYNLAIEEPSGICFDESFNSLWIVGGASQKIYKIDKQGNVLKELSYLGNDLEGIAFDYRDSTLWVVEEELHSVIHLDQNGNVITKKKFAQSDNPNNGFEGIYVDVSGNIHLVNEKNPAALIRLNTDLTIKDQLEINFAKDLSDISYNRTNDIYFFLSDESKAIYAWSFSQNVIEIFDLPFTKAEGIAVNPEMNKVFVVNDSLNTLCEYEIKDF